MATTEKARRENRHRSNVNNPNNPEFGRGFEQPGVPLQPAQAGPGQGRPDRIDEGRGQAPDRGRDELGALTSGAGAPPSTPRRYEAGGFGGQVTQRKEDHFASTGSPFVGSVGAFYSKVEASGALPNGVSADAAATAVLCTLALRLSGGEARAMRESLLPELGALLDSCILHRGERAEAFGKQDFVRRIAGHLGVGEDEAAAVARAVLLALHAQLPSKRIHDIESQLPKDLVEFWRIDEARDRVRERIGTAGGG